MVGFSRQKEKRDERAKEVETDSVVQTLIVPHQRLDARL